MTLLYFVIILGLIILVHEFGHFIFAKKFGVHVYEFSLGMGPKIWSTKRKNDPTEYSIRAIPIGGFVSLAGEEVDDDKEVPKDKKLFAKPIWQRFLIMFFGAGNNFILAFLIFFLVAIFTGAPVMDPVLNGVEKGYPAYEEGLRKDDKIVSINGHKTKTIDDVQLYLILAEPGKEVEFEVEKEKTTKTYKVTPRKEKVEGEEVYRLGIEFLQSKKEGLIYSIKYSFLKIEALVRQMVVVLGNLFTGNLSLNSLSGPVGIYSIVGDARSYGLASILLLTAMLSVNVGFINLVPFPAFDGGRILFLLIEKIKGSPVKPETENMIHMIGFILLIILSLVITFNDVIKLIFK